MSVSFHATTICAVRHNGHTAMAGDGSVADAFNLEDRFEKKLNQYSGNLQRAAVELAQEWRSDQALQKLEALLIVMDKENLLLVSGSGEVIEPDDDIFTNHNIIVEEL